MGLLGHPTRARWGSPLWGDLYPYPVTAFKLDAVAKKLGDQRSFRIDATAGLVGAERSWSLDALALATATRSFAVDVYQERVPTDRYLDTATAPVVLASLSLVGGDLNVASHDLLFDGQAWEGRLVSSGAVLRTAARGSDDMRLVLEDTTERGERLRQAFRNHPPEGRRVRVWIALRDDPAQSRVQLFDGVIDRVASFTDTTVSIDVLRTEIGVDRLLGRLLNSDDWPNAPDETLSRMIPIVFGQVDTHEGLIVSSNPVGELAFNVPATPSLIPPPGPGGVIQTDFTQTLTLVDGSAFPLTNGVLQINQEEIGYSTRTGNVFNRLLRGENGTAVQEHARGDQVRLKADFDVLFADHPLGYIQRVKLLTPSGNLGDPVPDPNEVLPSEAIVRWTETPRIRDPEAASVFQRVHFSGPAPDNVAENASAVARESGSYRAFGVADLSTGKLSLLTNAGTIGVPGDIVRAWLAVIHDPKGLGANATGDNSPDAEGIPGAARATIPAGGVYALQPFDVVPPEIAKRDEKTGDRLYDIPDPEPVVEIGIRVLNVTPRIIEDPGLWVFPRIAARVVDNDETTEAVFIFSSAGYVTIVGRDPAIFRVFPRPALAPDETVVKAVLEFVAGWEKTPFSSPMKFYGVKPDGTRFAEKTVVSFSIAGYPQGVIQGIKSESIEFDPAELGPLNQLEDLEDIEWVIEPVLGVSNGLWVGRELRLTFEIEKRPPETKVELDTKGSVTNYFEVTNYLGRRPGAFTPQADWSFFSDLQRGGKASYERVIESTSPRIIETFWVVEYRPFVEITDQVPRVFADVEGRVPTGNPADVSEAIVRDAVPLGMGLGLPTISRPDYNNAKATLANDGVRTDFALTAQTNARALLATLADQADCRQTWENGRHRLIRRPSVTNPPPRFKTLSDSEILEAPLLRLSRTTLRSVVNRIAVAYRVYAPTGSTSRTLEVVDSSSESSFGRREEALSLTLIRDDDAAEFVAQRRLERQREPRWVVEFDLPLLGLEYRFGDVVGLISRAFNADTVEVVGLTVDSDQFKTVRLSGVVWRQNAP